MKYKLLILILGILIVGTVIAGVGLSKDKTTKLKKQEKQFYDDLGIHPSYEDYEQDGKYWRCLISDTSFRLPCSLKKPIENLTEEQREQNLDKWQDKTLEKIAKAYLKRKETSDKEIKRTGNISIIE